MSHQTTIQNTSGGVWSNLPPFPQTPTVPFTSSSGTITQIAQNSFIDLTTLSSTPPLGLQRNEAKRIRNANTVFLTEEPELWQESRMPSESELIQLIFDWLSPDDISDFDSLFPIDENTDVDKLSLLNARIKEISSAIDLGEFTVSHKHIFYLYQLYVKITFKELQNNQLKNVIALISNSFFSATCSLLEKLSEITTVPKLKVPNLSEIALLVRYANILSWPNESYADYLRCLIQAYIFRTEIEGFDPAHKESWRSVGYMLDYVIVYCEELLNSTTGPKYENLKAAVERPSRSQTANFKALDHYVIAQSLIEVKILCQNWKDSLTGGVEIQLPMLYHGCRKQATFHPDIISSHIIDFEDRSKTIYTGAFLSTWPEVFFGPPTASFSNLQLFRAPSDLHAKFDPATDPKVKGSASLENTRWISFRDVVPVSLHNLDENRSNQNTILTFGVKAENIVKQKFETAAHPVMSFQAQKTLAFCLRAFPFLVPRYFSDEHRNFIRPHLQHLYPNRTGVAPQTTLPRLNSSFSSSSSIPSTTSTTTRSKKRGAKRRKK